MNLKLGNVESTKAGTVITNAYRFACVGKNILKQGMMNFVIQAFNFKVKFPTRRERGADTNHARSLYNHGAHIKIKRLIGILIEFVRNGKSVMVDLIRVYKHSGLKKLFISFATLASDFETDRGLYHRAFYVAGGLVDFLFGIGVKIFFPFYAVILRARGLASPFAHRFQFRHWESVLKQWCSPLNGSAYGIHHISLTKVRRSAFPIFLSQRIGVSQSDGLMLEIKKRRSLCDTMIIPYRKQKPPQGGLCHSSMAIPNYGLGIRFANSYLLRRIIPWMFQTDPN